MMSHTAPQQHSVTRETPDRNPELDAYNAAFHELELDWEWDCRVFRELADISGERERICAYLRAHRPHLLSVYEADALAEHIVEAKSRVLARSASRN